MIDYSMVNTAKTATGARHLILLLVMGIVSCRHEVSAAEMSEKGAASTTPAQGDGPAPAARFDEAAFALTIEPNGPCAAGKAGAAAVKLVAKGSHHINQEYPYKLKLKAEEGVAYPQSVIQRDAMKIGNTQAEFSIPFTPKRSGTVTVAGDFAFSLCTVDRCLIEKRPLALALQVP